jgi:hypothetical protein
MENHFLTDSMMRLRDEILALRQGREEFMTDLKRETGNRRTKVSRQLAQLCTDFTEASRTGKAGRTAFLADLRGKIGDLRIGVREDLGGAQQALTALRLYSARPEGGSA